MAKHLEGIFTPTIVPYDSQGRIDEDQLRRMVRWIGEKGVTGFYPNGSTGEFIRLSFEERKQVTRIVVEESGGKPVLAGASEPNIDLVLEMCAYCADLGCRAVSITGPYYYKLSQEGIEEYFRQLAAKSPIDIIIYNIPDFANEISVPVLKRLALDCPRIAGTKDSSLDMPRFQQILHEIKPQRPDFSALIGWEELLCSALFMGADGGTLATSGIIPEVIMKMYNDARSGNWGEVKRIQFKLLDLFLPILNAPNLIEGVRLGYELRGFSPGRARFPLSASEENQRIEMRSRIACVLAECGFAEAAHACERHGDFPDPQLRAAIEEIVRRVIKLKQ